MTMPLPVCGWSRKDCTTQGGSATQRSGHVQPGNDSHNSSFEGNQRDNDDDIHTRLHNCEKRDGGD